ncbi:hypothetical protein [Aureispira sp. CCB-E]|uniref:hypothetical protein n=1 Tax=Aureispira sp. CCB-E TaxID=3051121 RepID=UPI0028691E58|nr:hypothetical protein [Aureispira sp. CCB-E]WMX16523.1 hypothetical protein QP953_09105 [Aureispira sp. CCB-E]
MDINTAARILSESASKLSQRLSKLNPSHIQTEVMNNTCLYLLKQKKENPFYHKEKEDTALFFAAATQLFPKDFDKKTAERLLMGLHLNLEFEGMWDFLRIYFYEKHGEKIDDVYTISHKFYATEHKRFEFGKLIADERMDVERIVIINFIGSNREEAIVSIEPNLSAKKAYKLSCKNEKYTYKGYDPDYLFHIDLDFFGEVERFAIELPHRSLIIEYFE